jgi:hypothetical protein
MAALIADVESDIKHAIRQGKELKKGMRFWNNRDAAARRAKVLKSNSEKPRTWDALMMVEAELDGETPKRICNTYNQRYAAKIAKGDMKRATPAILKCEKNRRKAAE